MGNIPTVTLSEKRLQEILYALPSARIGLIGDACVDIYWFADMQKSELSRETPHYPLPVISERFSLGAAANVAANIKALGVPALKFISLAGKDWRAQILKDLLAEEKIGDDYIVQQGGMVTPSYCKPMRQGISDVIYEDPRIDFMNYQPLSQEGEEKLLEALEEILPEIDILAVSDQLVYGCISPKVRQRILEIGEIMPVVVDSRDRAQAYHSVIVKPNEVEAGALLQQNILEGNLADNLLEAGKKISETTKRPVIITLGSKGSFYYSETTVGIAPALPVKPPIDFVGAGDSFLSAFCSALAVGATGPEAIAFGNLASAVVIKKIGITGVATPAEIQQRYLQKED